MKVLSDKEINRTRAWAAFILGTVFFGYAFLHRVAPSVITSELMRDLSVGAAALGGLSAFYFYAYASIQLPVGILMDRYGPKKLLTIALLVCALASVGFGSSESLTAASFYRAVIGGTVAFGFVGTLTIATYWFPPSRFAVLTGLLMTVGMAGAIAGQAPLRLLVEALHWRHSFYLMAGFAVLLAVAIFAVVPVRPAAQTGSEPASPLRGIRVVVGNPQSWYCALAGFGASGMLLAFASLWSVPWLHSVRGLAPAEAAAVSSAVFLGWAMGAPGLGWLSDFMGRRKPVIYAGLGLSFISFSVILLVPIGSAAAMAALFFLNGVGSSAMVLCFGTIRELNLPQHSGTALGLANMFTVGSGAVLQPLIGWILDVNWRGEISDGARVYDASAYSIAFTSLLFAVSISLICCFLMKETHCRPLSDHS